MAKLNIQPISKERLKELSAKIAEGKLKGKTQVKLFQGSSNIGDFENEINQFLNEKGDNITFKDIKLCTRNNTQWTAMVIYEVK